MFTKGMYPKKIGRISAETDKLVLTAFSLLSRYVVRKLTTSDYEIIHCYSKQFLPFVNAQ